MKGGVSLVLTEEQRKVVTENHNLIYWYINLKGLDIDEWYDILAIELCNTVMRHDPSKASLITYFKIRADSRFHKEWIRNNRKKRVPRECEVSLEEEHHGTYEIDDLVDGVEFLDHLDELEKDIVMLTYKGYSQIEVSELLQVNQSFVSRKLRRIREKYGEKINY